MRLTLSVVICTRNRPADLATCLASLGIQTRLPDEVLIVDASDGPEPAARVREWAASAPVPRVRVLESAPGLTRQRNLGIAATSGGIVTFLDDDVVLDPGYLAAVVALFELDSALGGVQGTVAFAPLRGRRRLANAFRRVFLMNTLGGGGAVKRSGFVRYDPAPGVPRVVTWLVGCNMSYRRDVFARHRFDEWYDGYGLGEDQDFSYRVARTHRLVQTPAARLEHRLSPVARERAGALAEMAAVNHHHFVRKNLPRTPFTWLCYAWSELGELLAVGKAGDRQALAGRLRGYRRILHALDPARAGVPAREALS